MSLLKRPWVWVLILLKADKPRAVKTLLRGGLRLCVWEGTDRQSSIVFGGLDQANIILKLAWYSAKAFIS